MVPDAKTINHELEFDIYWELHKFTKISIAVVWSKSAGRYRASGSKNAWFQ
jgi:hypothetical protein